MHMLRCRRQRHDARHTKRCNVAVKATCPLATTLEETAGTVFRWRILPQPKVEGATDLLRVYLSRNKMLQNIVNLA